MIEETCLPAAVATEEVQNRRNLRGTQAAEEGQEGEPVDRMGSPLASPVP
jgi:hypothetical protein